MSSSQHEGNPVTSPAMMAVDADDSYSSKSAMPFFPCLSVCRLLFCNSVFVNKLTLPHVYSDSRFGILWCKLLNPLLTDSRDCQTEQVYPEQLLMERQMIQCRSSTLHNADALTLVTTLCSSPVSSSYPDCMQTHCDDGSVPLLPLLTPLNAGAAADGSLLFACTRRHVLFGCPRRKLSENWLKPMNKAGMHVKTISCIWNLPKPPRLAKTPPSICESKSGVLLVSGVTKPFSGGWGSVSSWETAITVSHILSAARFGNASDPQIPSSRSINAILRAAIVSD